MGDLSPEVTDAELKATFLDKYASVLGAKVVTNPMTGSSKSFGFIRFGDEQERDEALTAMNGAECCGRPIRVAPATKRTVVQGECTRTSIVFLLLFGLLLFFHSVLSCASDCFPEFRLARRYHTIAAAVLLPWYDAYVRCVPAISFCLLSRGLGFSVFWHAEQAPSVDLRCSGTANSFWGWGDRSTYYHKRID